MYCGPYCGGMYCGRYQFELPPPVITVGRGARRNDHRARTVRAPAARRDDGTGTVRAVIRVASVTRVNDVVVHKVPFSCGGHGRAREPRLRSVLLVTPPRRDR